MSKLKNVKLKNVKAVAECVRSIEFCILSHDWKKCQIEEYCLFQHFSMYQQICTIKFWKTNLSAYTIKSQITKCWIDRVCCFLIIKTFPIPNDEWAYQPGPGLLGAPFGRTPVRIHFLFYCWSLWQFFIYTFLSIIWYSIKADKIPWPNYKFCDIANFVTNLFLTAKIFLTAKGGWISDLFWDLCLYSRIFFSLNVTEFAMSRNL